MTAMDFVRRRLMMAMDSGPKYVWAVYALTYAIDESAGGTSGSVSMSTYFYKQVATSYTVSADGTVSLTNPVQTYVLDMKAGGYLVDVSTSDNTSTTGKTLYKITSLKFGMSKTTIYYTAYTPTLIKGDTELYRVESDTMDYPADGEQDGLWYVMLKGEVEKYVWNTYKATITYKYVETTGTITAQNLTTSGTLYYYYKYEFDETTGKYTLGSGSTKYTYSTIDSSTLKSMYWAIGSYNTNKIYYGWTNIGNATDGYSITPSSAKASSKGTEVLSAVKGSLTGTVESLNASEYPTDNYVGTVWYTYSHSYLSEFDNT